MGKAVHFGAGNIGRGFIGLLLNKSGYEITFVDVNGEVVAALNNKGKYRVNEVGDDEKEYCVDNVKGLSSKRTEAVAKEIAQADLVTTAVGAGNLKFLVPAIVQGIKKRLAQNNLNYLNIIACENAVQASSKLQKEVNNKLTEEERQTAAKYIGFPDAAVDRIVPPQAGEGLEVKVEPFREWIIDKTQIKGPTLEIKGTKLTDNLLAFVERKIFTLNTGHCGTAYLGYLKGYKYIHEAINDQEIYNIIKTALMESGSSLIDYYGFKEVEHKKYIKKTLNRFKNPALQDSVVRVGREPIRKLGPEDRLVKPALRAIEVNRFPIGLSQCIAAGFLFTPKEDKEAHQIQKMINRQGLKTTLEEITEIKADSMLGKEIIRRYQQLKKFDGHAISS